MAPRRKPDTFLKRWSACRNGGIAVWAAFAVPVVAVMAVGATELAAIVTDRSHLQDVADAAALQAAKQLPLTSPEAALEQAKALALHELSAMAQRSTLTADAEIVQDGAGVRVRLSSHRMSFFGNMLPPGGFTTGAQATAVVMGRSPICVLGLDETTGSPISLGGSSEIRAPKCMVHSNRDLEVTGGAHIQAETTQASGQASGRITPAALTGAKPLADPFAGRKLASPTCDEADDEGAVYVDKVQHLKAGVHCGLYDVGQSARLRLLPGDHYFVAPPGGPGGLSISSHAALEGQNVTLHFGRNTTLNLTGQADVDLKGRRTGSNAGMLIIAARDNTGVFDFGSHSIRRLEGVIYMPEAELHVSGGNVSDVAAESKWTVTVTKRLRLTAALNLVMNSDYDASDVPLPLPAANGATRLIR